MFKQVQVCAMYHMVGSWTAVITEVTVPSKVKKVAILFLAEIL